MPNETLLEAAHNDLPPPPSRAHFHVWLRSGRVFTMRLKRYASQPVAHRAAAKLRPDPADRMVRQCTCCPVTQRSKRPAREPRIAAVAAAELSRALRVEVTTAAVRRALQRGRWAVEAGP